MKKLPDSLVEKIGDLPAEEVLKMLASPDSAKNLNLTLKCLKDIVKKGE